jgi:aspartate-semialdehyde dehydrogenase
MLLVLGPLHEKYGVKRVVVSTYQSVTGTGIKAFKQLENEEKGINGIKAYPHQIFRNCLPHCADFEDNDYTTEENKLVNETHKILDPAIKVTATCVRVPVIGGHSEAVNIEFERDFDLSELRSLLANTAGVTLQDDIHNAYYPMPVSAEDKDDVFVGRIRRDHSNPNSLNLWIVSDNLRKGAATNTVQIAEDLLKKFF